MAILRPRLLAVLVLSLASSQARGEDAQFDEYRVKAAFIYNFAKFVEWPPEAFDGRTSPIRICIFGRNPFGSAMEDAVRGKTVDGRGFLIRPVDKTSGNADCQILFVSKSERGPLGTLLGQFKSPYLLAVGESDGFIANGGVINFAIKDSRVRIQIDAAAASRAKFRISSKLLSIAEIVKP